MPTHGHVTPNADGSKAKCGGPAICSECALEWARLTYRAGVPATPLLTPSTSPPDQPVTRDQAERVIASLEGIDQKLARVLGVGRGH